MGKLVLALLLLSLVVGQIVRFPLPGQGGGLLMSDVAVVLILVVALLSLIRKHKFKNTKPEDVFGNSCFRICLCFVFFALWSLFTLIIRTPDLGLTNSLIALSYWLRLTAHLLLLPALVILLQGQALRRFATRGLLIATTTLVVLGFLQLIVMPNLNLVGWDPHQGRLVSTWLDPNFFGGFLVVVLPWLLVRTFLPLTVAVIAALVLTQSRSSFLALGAALVVASPFLVLRLRKSTLAFGSMLLLALLSIGLIALGDRALGALTLDPTAALRLESLRGAWRLAEQNPLLGVGYNAYQFAAQEAGLISNFSVHSRAGADNSWLTLWVTTGLIGMLLFATPWLYAARHVPFATNLSLLALLFHSQLTNSFLYSHLLITLILIIALTWKPTAPSSS